jgi:hypothetical protein
VGCRVKKKKRVGNWMCAGQGEDVHTSIFHPVILTKVSYTWEKKWGEGRLQVACVRDPEVRMVKNS